MFSDERDHGSIPSRCPTSKARTNAWVFDSRQAQTLGLRIENDISICILS